MDLFRFVDCNYPGTIYTCSPALGEAMMAGLAREGGCPSKVSSRDEEAPYVPFVDADGDTWAEQEAPAFWAEVSS